MWSKKCFLLVVASLTALSTTLQSGSAIGNTRFLSSFWEFQETLSLQLSPNSRWYSENFVYSPYGLDLMVYLASFNLDSVSAAILKKNYFGNENFEDTCFTLSKQLQHSGYSRTNNTVVEVAPYITIREPVNGTSHFNPVKKYLRHMHNIPKLLKCIERCGCECKNKKMFISGQKDFVKYSMKQTTYGIYTPQIADVSEMKYISLNKFHFNGEFAAPTFELEEKDALTFFGLNEFGKIVHSYGVTYMRLLTSSSDHVEVHSHRSFCFDAITLRYRDTRFSLNIFLPKSNSSFSACFSKMNVPGHTPNDLLANPKLCQDTACNYNIVIPEFKMILNNQNLNLNAALKTHQLNVFNRNTYSNLFLGLNNQILMQQFGYVGNLIPSVIPEEKKKKLPIGSKTVHYFINTAFAFQIRYRSSLDFQSKYDTIFFQGMVANASSLQLLPSSAVVQ